jgi:hypothetical protein
MRLRGGALRKFNLAPLGNKLFGGHARAGSASGRSVSAGPRADLGFNVGTGRLYRRESAASCYLATTFSARANSPAKSHSKPPRGYPEATLRPSGSQPVGTPKPP